MLDNSTTYQKIKTDLLEARKSRNTALVASVSTLLGEIQNKVGAQAADAEPLVIAVVKKYANNLDEAIKLSSGRGDPDQLEAAKAERRALEAYLPSQMNESELRLFVRGCKAKGIANKGGIMKELKSMFPNRYDGKLAASIIDEELL